MSNKPPRRGYPVSDAHLRAIGGIVVSWSHIEMAMEVAICGLYEINPDRGLVLTANIGFQSRVSLLRILGTRGAIKDEATATVLLALLGKIEAGYAERNIVAHGVWSGTADPEIGRRMSIRAKGSRLRCSDDQVSLAELEAIFGRIERLRLDFAEMLVRLNMPSPKRG